MSGFGKEYTIDDEGRIVHAHPATPSATNVPESPDGSWRKEMLKRVCATPPVSAEPLPAGFAFVQVNIDGRDCYLTLTPALCVEIVKMGTERPRE